MSSRALKRLNVKSDLEDLKESLNLISCTSSSPEECIDSDSNLFENKFDLLNCSGKDTLEDLDDLQKEVSPNPFQLKSCNFPKANSAKKKKKKKKQEKIDSSNPLFGDEDAFLEAAIREAEKDRSSQVNRKVCDNLKSPLTVDIRYLQPSHELRRMFGAEAVGSSNASRQKFKLARWKDTFPPLRNTGLHMEFHESSNELNWFYFSHGKKYQEFQRLFAEATSGGSHEAVMTILENSPYHLDSLLLMSDALLMQEDTSTAMQLNERVLCACEDAFHPRFSLVQGNARLSYKNVENRSFFIALRRQINFLWGLGCNRTALEVSKLLLSLNPDNDPLATLLLLDVCALKAGEYEWFYQLYQHLEEIRNLSHLPNFAYSVPLVLFLQSEKTENKEESEQLLITANKLLHKALLKFPGVLSLIMEKCCITSVALQSGNFFELASRRTTDSERNLHCLELLYIERCITWWTSPSVLSWLEVEVAFVLQDLAVKKDISDGYAQLRCSRYQGMPLNVLRHIVMADFKHIITELPKNTGLLDSVMYDPVPPPDSVRQYKIEESKILLRGATLPNFLESFLPTYTPSNTADGENLGDFSTRVQTFILESVQNAVDYLTTQRSVDNADSDEDDIQ